MKLAELGAYIRNQRKLGRLSLKKVSALAGVSIPYLSQIERGLRKPSAEILQAIAKGLRISAETLYVQAGILDERPAPDVITAIMADHSISERQKQALVQIYEAFREETGRLPGPEQPETPGADTRSGAARRRSAAGARGSKSSSGTRKTKVVKATSPRAGRNTGGGTGERSVRTPHPTPSRSPAAPTRKEV